MLDAKSGPDVKSGQEPKPGDDDRKVNPGEGRLAHAPANHPAVRKPRIGVLLANLGTPDSYDYWSMRRYLNEFLSDKRVVDYASWKWQPLLQLIILTKRPFSSGANYKLIWNHEANESPLLTITKAQTAAIAATIADRHGAEVMVDFCMRYGNPSTEKKVRAMVEAGCEKILFFPLYPHYAGATSATANDQFFRALMKEKRQPAVRTVPEYFAHPRYIDALAQSVERAYAALDHRPDMLVASYHGMPQRYLMEGDPYHCQCAKTSRLLRERLGKGRDRHHVPVDLRARGMAETLHGQTCGRACQAGQKAHRGDGPRLQCRLHRDTGRDQRRNPRGF